MQFLKILQSCNLTSKP